MSNENITVKPKYIWINHNGEIVKEKPRGKGRPPRNVEPLPRADGNYYITVVENNTTVTVVADNTVASAS